MSDKLVHMGHSYASSVKSLTISIYNIREKMSYSQIPTRYEYKKEVSQFEGSTCKYADYYNKNCFSLDARTFSDIKNTIINYITAPECPADVKMMFADWLFRKIYMNFKVPTHQKVEVVAGVITGVDECINIVTKAIYLKFHDDIAMSMVAKYFYDNRFADKDKYFILQLLNDTQLIKNYLQDPRFRDDDTLKNHFIQWCNSAPLLEQRSNILDVLLKHFPRDPEVVRIHERMRWEYGAKDKSVYSDAQNVHDESVQKSVKEAASNLLKYYDDLIENGHDLVPKMTTASDWAEYYLKSTPQGKNSGDLVKAVVDRCRIDTTNFVGIDKSFKVSDVLIALLHYIYYSESKDALIEILFEEMRAMVELCSSGYVARFLNVLQGFDDRFEVSISVDKQIYASLSYSFAKALEKANDNVISGTVDDKHRDEYLKFVISFINTDLRRLEKDYGRQDVTMYIIDCAKRLIGEDFILDTNSFTLKMSS